MKTYTTLEAAKEIPTTFRAIKYYIEKEVINKRRDEDGNPYFIESDLTSIREKKKKRT